MKEILYEDLGKYEHSIIQVKDINSDNQFMMLIIGQTNVKITVKKGRVRKIVNLPSKDFSGLCFLKGKRVDWFFEEEQYVPSNISFFLSRNSNKAILFCIINI